MYIVRIDHRPTSSQRKIRYYIISCYQQWEVQSLN